MKRIPRSSKVQTRIYKSFTVLDLIIIAIALILSAIFASFSFSGKWALVVGVLLGTVAMLFQVGEERMYHKVALVIRFYSRVRRYGKEKGMGNIDELIPYEKVDRDLIFNKDGSYVSVVMVEPINLFLMEEYEQDRYIDTFTKIIKMLKIGTSLCVLKLGEEVSFAKEIEGENIRLSKLESERRNLVYTDKEYASRKQIIQDRKNLLIELEKLKIEGDKYYIATISKESREAVDMARKIVDIFSTQKVQARVCMGDMLEKIAESACPLTGQITANIKPRKIESTKSPGEPFSKNKSYELVQGCDTSSTNRTYELVHGRGTEGSDYKPFSNNKTYEMVNGMGMEGSNCEPFSKNNTYELMQESGVWNPLSQNKKHGENINNQAVVTHMSIKGYPDNIVNGWASDIFSIKEAMVAMHIEPLDKIEVKKIIDTSIAEVGLVSSGRASEEMSSEIHAESLKELLLEMESGSQIVASVSIHVTVKEEKAGAEKAKKVKREIQESGFHVDDMIFSQIDGYVGSLLAPAKRKGRCMTSSTIGSAFPFVSDEFKDKAGLLIGENSSPVFLDIFKRDLDRVNSNMVIIGRPGSGKSYAAKTMLTGLSTEGNKIFILDPEGEYSGIVKNLGGEELNPGSSSIINPLEITKGLPDESGLFNEDIYVHMQFLEEFFKVALPGASSETLERLSRLISEMYEALDIPKNIKKLKSLDYPTFDDLSNFVIQKIQESDSDKEKERLVTVYNLLAKFREGGIYHLLWNGHTTFNASGKLKSYNFKSLLSGKNSTVCNAQMLLVLRLLENEILKNKDENIKGSSCKICVVIDEAHIFIDEKYPVALDFMYSLAKRIRKYDGMLMVITQNVLDFAGTPETLRKTSAIINTSQYSLIFSLNPGDISDLSALYSRAGDISEQEKEAILRNPRGRALFIASPSRKTFVDIVATKKTSETWGE